MSLCICLVAQPLVKQNNVTNIQAFKSHLHGPALSLLASTMHRAFQGLVSATKDTVAQGTLRWLRGTQAGCPETQ